MEEQKTFEDMKANVRAKWMAFKVKAKAKVDGAVQWVREHPDEATILASTGVAALGAVLKTAKFVDHKLDAKREQDLHDLDIYDRSLGLYHHLKHKLRPWEIQEIDQRRQSGESLTSILNDMNLVK